LSGVGVKNDRGLRFSPWARRRGARAVLPDGGGAVPRWPWWPPRRWRRCAAATAVTSPTVEAVCRGDRGDLPTQEDRVQRRPRTFSLAVSQAVAITDRARRPPRRTKRRAV